MIPHRITLTGFLSYRDEQEIVFDGSPLWMLSGRNGSGKSSIFDGFTFALFGHHRGGSQQVQELINKASNSLTVEFDFSIDQQRYRIRRTAKKNPRGGLSSTQQIFRADTIAETMEQSWAAISDTNRRKEFDEWIHDKIGLDYETFTSSVLLLQGRAEKLLDATPKGRAEVLAGIVDLEHYQRLHERADDTRKKLKGQVEQVESQIEHIHEVTDEQLRDLDARLLGAEELRALAEVEVEKWQRMEFEARKWEELQSRISRLHEQWKSANALLGDADNIEVEYQRLNELREVLPHINGIHQLLAEMEASGGRTKKHLGDRDQVRQQRDGKNRDLDLARQKRTTLQKQQTQDDQQRQQLDGQLRELAVVVERLKLFEDEQTRLVETENQLQRLPANARQAVAEAQTQLEGTQEKAAALPTLERFAASRAELEQHRQRLIESTSKEKNLRKQGEEAKKRHEKAKADHDTAAKAREAADARATELQTLLQQAKADLDEIQKLKGKKICRQCGQPLTANHLKEEKTKRERECTEAETAHGEAAKIQTEAKTLESKQFAEVRLADEALNQLRDSFRDATREIDQANRDVERCTTDCRKSYEAIPTRFQQLIAPSAPEDWSTTSYPKAADLAALRREAAEVEALRRRVREAEEAGRKGERLQSQAEASRQTLARLRKDLPSDDPVKIRGDFATAQSEETALKNRLAGAKKSLTENQNEIDRLQIEVTRIDKQVAEVETHLRGEEVHRKNGEDAIERARRSLPEKWQFQSRDAGMTVQHQWNVELQELEERNVGQRYQQLAQARMGLQGLKTDLAESEAQAKNFSEEARETVAVVKERLQQAKQSELEREKVSRGIQSEKSLLEQYREQRAKLSGDLLARQHDLKYYELLAKLLGRDRLQRHLVRVAERQIVDYTNGVLDRLSGGQLRLRICVKQEDGSSAERALELEAYNRITGDEPINISFLSGSQRFRVAVSLALGIGQYASRQHRPIESVIIDEGFGCLDREGRQVMIQELQNLRGQLKRILLVSHQEEFADAFPDGYRFVLEDGSTRVTRFQR